MTTALVLLAAQLGGVGYDLRAEVEGRAVLNQAVDYAIAAGVGPVYVVVGEVAAVAPATSMHTAGLRVLRNPQQEGLATSLQVAIAAAQADGHDALVVGLGDQPLVEPAAWRLLARATAPLVVATYSGHQGYPVRLAAELWAWLPTTGDDGVRGLVHQHPDLVVEIPCPGDPHVVDTTADLTHAVADQR